MSKITDQMSMFFAWERATKDAIDVKKIYIDMVDDIVAGLLLSQIVYWHLPSLKTDPAGVVQEKQRLRVFKDGHHWLAKGRADWFDECRIKERQFDTAVSKLEARGLVEKRTIKFNGNPTVHVRIVWDKFIPKLYEFLAADNLYDVADMEFVKSLSHFCENHVITGSDQSVITDSDDQKVLQILDDAGYHESVITKSQIGEMVVPKSVITLTENTNREKQEDESSSSEVVAAYPELHAYMLQQTDSEFIDVNQEQFLEECLALNIPPSTARRFYLSIGSRWNDANYKIIRATFGDYAAYPNHVISPRALFAEMFENAFERYKLRKEG